MSQRPSSRSNANERPTSRSRNAESNYKCERQRRTECRRTDVIQEASVDNGQPMRAEEQHEFQMEPRYDPKELRDAAKKLSSFLKLIELTNNPYARVVAREVCKTYYRLYNPNQHSSDVIQSINWDVKCERSRQLWSEFWLYVPGSKIKEWVSLRTYADVTAANSDENFDPNQLQVTPVRRRSDRRRKIAQPKLSLDPMNAYTSDSPHSDLINVSPPDIMYDHNIMSAGSDSQPSPKNYNRHAAGANMYTPSPPTSESGCHRHVVAATSNNNARDRFECCRTTGNKPTPRHNQRIRMVQPLPRTPVEPELRTNALNNSAALIDDDDDNSDSVDSLNRTEILTSNADKVACAFTDLSLAQQEFVKKRIAFSAVTQNCLQSASKKYCDADAYQSTHDRRLKDVSPTVRQKELKKKLRFDDSEWNENAFKDRDFIRMIPFYEIVHNQIEYIATEQQQYSLNMLDDIMSLLYHIHYELGDPRLKNDLLVTHVNAVTRNTWEKYFYPDTDKMPVAPEPHQLHYSPSPQNTPSVFGSPPQPPYPSTPQHMPAVVPYQLPPCEPSTSSQTAVQLPPCDPSTSSKTHLRRSEKPKLSNRRAPSLEQTRTNKESKTASTTDRRPRTTSNTRRAADVPNAPSETQNSNCMRTLPNFYGIF